MGVIPMMIPSGSECHESPATMGQPVAVGMVAGTIQRPSAYEPHVIVGGLNFNVVIDDNGGAHP